jgi:23S rRNA G2069 N7-methylase RlmK/C1962 C5-methylase RlmI
MKNQKMQLTDYGVVGLQESEKMQITGGGTDFAYDVGAALRLGFFSITGNVSGVFSTVVNWFIQTNK